MEDLEVPQGDDPETPASPGSEEEPAPEEKATKGEKPDADDDDQDTREETSDEGDEDSSEEGRGGDFDQLLAKYDGDKDKLAKAYFEQATSTARIAKRLEAIEEYVKGGQQKEPEVDEEKLVAQDPDVKEIVKDYNDVQADIRASETRQNTLISEYGKLEKKIERLQGKLEASTEYEAKQEIREELAELRAEQKNVHSDIRGSQADIKRYTGDLKDLARKYREAEAKAKEGASRQRQAELERRQEGIATREEFAGAMRKEADRYGIPKESKQYAVLFQSINDRIYSYLLRLPKDAPAVDIPGAVGALMAEYAETLGLKARFSKASKAKREATSSDAQKAGTLPKGAKEPPPPKEGRWTKEYVQERARRLLG